MPTEKTTYFDWDKPVFPSDNLATEFDTLFDQIDNTVNTVTGFNWSVSNNGTEIISSPTDINFTTDIEVFDNGDGTVSVSSTALSTSEKGAADGVAELDSSSKILSSQLPSLTITETDVVADKTERLALDAEKGDVAIQQDKNQSYILKGTDPTLDSEWTVLQSPTSDLTSVFGRTGDVTAQSNDYTHDQIGGQASDDHHTRYSDSEAISAINTDTDHGSTASHNYFSGSHSDLSGIASDDHHTRYTGSEARSAVASEPVGHPSYATLSDTPTLSLGDTFHIDGDGLYVYTDGVDAIDNSDTPLQVHIDDNTNPHNVTDISGDADTVDGYNIQKNGTDGSDIINFKT